MHNCTHSITETPYNSKQKSHHKHTHSHFNIHSNNNNAYPQLRTKILFTLPHPKLSIDYFYKLCKQAYTKHPTTKKQNQHCKRIKIKKLT